MHKAYLDPKIEVFLYEIDFDEGIGFSCRIEQPVLGNHFPAHLREVLILNFRCYVPDLLCPNIG